MIAADDLRGSGDAARSAPEAILNSLSANIAVINHAGEIVSVNRAWREFALAADAGDNAGIGLGSNYLQVLDRVVGPDAVDAGTAARGIRTVLSEDVEEFSHEYACPSPTKRRWFRMQATPIQLGGRRGAVLSHLEITARKNAETLLEQERRLLEQFATGTTLSPLLDELARNIERQSIGLACSILRLDRDGVHLRHGAAPNLPDEYNKAVHGIAIGPNVGSCGTAAFRRELVVVKDIAIDPLWKPYRDLALGFGLRACWSKPIFSATGKVLGTFAMYYREPREPTAWELDLISRATNLASVALERFAAIEERELLEEQFRQAQKMEAVGRLAGGIAHDFNNLLAVVAGYVDILMTSIRPGDPREEPLREIQRANDRAASLTAQLLAFSRKQTVEVVPVDVNNLLLDRHKMLAAMLGSEVELRLRLAPNLPALQTDPHHLENAVVNLLVNAKDAMPRGGVATVATDLWRSDRAHPNLPVGSYLRVIVGDTGTGMDERTRQRAFEPFFTTKEPGKGTGLGLAMVHGFMEQIGGSVDIESRFGSGTVVTMCLPLDQSSRDAATDSQRSDLTLADQSCHAASWSI